MNPSEKFVQFAHIKYASPKAPKSTGEKGSDGRTWSIAALLNESDRKPGSCSHVESPKPPNWIIGSAKIVKEQATHWHAQAREAGGKAKLRQTSPALACAVVSWPSKDTKGWQQYANDVLRFFVATVGRDRIVGVVEHLDEAHPHMHVYIVPKHGDDFGSVHPGYKASREARKLPGNHVTVKYKQAMSRWQDDLFAATGERHGLARIGPARERLSRMEWNAEKRGLDAARKKAREAAEIETAEVFAKAKEQTAEAELAPQRAQQAFDDVQLQAEAVQKERALLDQHPNAAIMRELMAARARIESLEKKVDAADFRERAQKEREASRRGGTTVMARPRPTPFD